MKSKLTCSIILLLFAGNAASAGDREVVKETTVRASLEDVWNAWTTEDGLKFISAKSNVELRRGGPYEWFLDGPADESGRRGGEGSKILAWLPHEMLAFSWTFAPATPNLRRAQETTQVIVNFTPGNDGTVHVRLTAHEWQDGEEWDAGYEYFDEAWGYVLTALQANLDDKPANQ